jgi:hypothetical protein
MTLTSAPKVFAFHAHLYNESGDAAHPRSGAQNFRTYPWEKLTTVAIRARPFPVIYFRKYLEVVLSKVVSPW